MSGSVSKWDPRKVVDLAPAEIADIKARQALAQQRKHEFRKIAEDPFRQGKGGHVFDPAMQRWYTARATYGDHFRVNTRGLSVLMLAYVLPVAAFTYYVTKDKNTRDSKCRKGEVPTKDKVLGYAGIDMYFA